MAFVVAANGCSPHPNDRTISREQAVQIAGSHRNARFSHTTSRTDHPIVRKMDKSWVVSYPGPPDETGGTVTIVVNMQGDVVTAFASQ
jgi:hypothetical protein